MMVNFDLRSVRNETSEGNKLARNQKGKWKTFKYTETKNVTTRNSETDRK